MNYLELIMLISERGEKSVSEKLSSIRTDKFLYHRSSDGNWEQLDLPAIVEEEKYLPISPTETKEKHKK
jgi:hypothetical protein